MKQQAILRWCPFCELRLGVSEQYRHKASHVADGMLSSIDSVKDGIRDTHYLETEKGHQVALAFYQKLWAEKEARARERTAPQASRGPRAD